mmetsp:Transcript_52224/g.93983  ORF Transcript_52224/g.93983 Transcript_52224/m.93983 type:complete len:115 (+) Transcript_52224:147-491(+)
MAGKNTVQATMWKHICCLVDGAVEGYDHAKLSCSNASDVCEKKIQICDDEEAKVAPKTEECDHYQIILDAKACAQSKARMASCGYNSACAIHLRVVLPRTQSWRGVQMALKETF